MGLPYSLEEPPPRVQWGSPVSQRKVTAGMASSLDLAAGLLQTDGTPLPRLTPGAQCEACGGAPPPPSKAKGPTSGPSVGPSLPAPLPLSPGTPSSHKGETEPLARPGPAAFPCLPPGLLHHLQDLLDGGALDAPFQAGRAGARLSGTSGLPTPMSRPEPLGRFSLLPPQQKRCGPLSPLPRNPACLLASHFRHRPARPGSWSSQGMGGSLRGAQRAGSQRPEGFLSGGWAGGRAGGQEGTAGIRHPT